MERTVMYVTPELKDCYTYMTWKDCQGENVLLEMIPYKVHEKYEDMGMGLKCVLKRRINRVIEER